MPVRSLLAVVPVRDGALPAGGAECAAEVGWRSVVVGTGAAHGAAELGGDVWVIEAGPWDVHAYASLVATAVCEVDAEATIILPASPDGRDLAPRLAMALHRPLVAPCVRVTPELADRVRTAGRTVEVVSLPTAAVTTLIPGVRGVERPTRAHHSGVQPLSGSIVGEVRADDNRPVALVIGVDPPDPATADLTEAPRVVAGGNGLGSAERFAQLGRIGALLGASLGGTRVASDAGWIPFERQIGTTGVAINPRLYLAFAISGATQHTTGIGSPEHIISVNTDPSCPMMTMADVAIVSDANAVLDALEALLATTTQDGSNAG